MPASRFRELQLSLHPKKTNFGAWGDQKCSEISRKAPKAVARTVLFIQL